jgi:hypothetical protein
VKDSPSSDQCWPLALVQATCLWRFFIQLGFYRSIHPTNQFIVLGGSMDQFILFGVLHIIFLLVRFWHYCIIPSSSASGFCFGSSREKYQNWNLVHGIQ